MDIRKLEDWAKSVVEKYETVAKAYNISYYTQSDLGKLSDSSNVAILILGINPGSEGAYEKKDWKSFMKGNKCFNPNVTWRIWSCLKKILFLGQIDYLLADETRFVFSNIYHFSTLKAKDLSSEIKGDNDYVELTLKLIRTLHPQMVLCLGKNDCMQKIIEKPHELINDELSYGMVGETPIYGIPHTSKFYTNEESILLGKVLGTLFRGEIKPDKRAISTVFCEEIKAFEIRKNQIKPENILNSMIEDSFSRFASKEKWEKDGKWYKISSHFIVRVTSTGGGYVSIRDSQYDKNNNYSKRSFENKDKIISYLKTKGYELKREAESTSLGHKSFHKYETWKNGPQYVVLSIFEEIDDLETNLENILNNK
jgi:hypothetical protein